MPRRVPLRPPERLSGERVELRLLRVLPAGDLAKRDAATAFLAVAPEVRFAIHRLSDGLRVGRIHLRVTDDDGLVDTVGHIGYEVDAEHRRSGYATHAIRLVTEVADVLGQATVWALVEPDNVASRRALERAGYDFMDEVDARPDALGLGLGPRLCRYVSRAP